jgi:hypothetical protein
MGAHPIHDTRSTSSGPIRAVRCSPTRAVSPRLTLFQVRRTVRRPIHGPRGEVDWMWLPLAKQRPSRENVHALTIGAFASLYTAFVPALPAPRHRGGREEAGGGPGTSVCVREATNRAVLQLKWHEGKEGIHLIFLIGEDYTVRFLRPPLMWASLPRLASPLRRDKRRALPAFGDNFPGGIFYTTNRGVGYHDLTSEGVGVGELP